MASSYYSYLLLLFSTKPKNANEKILVNIIASMYELQIIGNASIIRFTREIVICLKTDQCGQKKLANSKNIEKKPFAQHRIIFEDAL
jgi:hypothetical protein